MDMKSLWLPDHILTLRHHFYVLIFKKTWFYGFSFDRNSAKCEWWVTAADRSAWSVLYMYDWFFNRYITPIWPPQVRCQLLSADHCHYFKLSAIRTVSSACLIYWKVSIDHRWWYVAVTHPLQSYRYCLKRNRQAVLRSRSRSRSRKEPQLLLEPEPEP